MLSEQIPFSQNNYSKAVSFVPDLYLQLYISLLWQPNFVKVFKMILPNALLCISYTEKQYLVLLNSAFKSRFFHFEQCICKTFDTIHFCRNRNRFFFYVKLSHTEIHKGVTRGDEILIEATFDTNDPCIGMLVVTCVTATVSSIEGILQTSYILSFVWRFLIDTISG